MVFFTPKIFLKDLFIRDTHRDTLGNRQENNHLHFTCWGGNLKKYFPQFYFTTKTLEILQKYGIGYLFLKNYDRSLCNVKRICNFNLSVNY